MFLKPENSDTALKIFKNVTYKNHVQRKLKNWKKRNVKKIAFLSCRGSDPPPPLGGMSS